MDLCPLDLTVTSGEAERKCVVATEDISVCGKRTGVDLTIVEDCIDPEEPGSDVVSEASSSAVSDICVAVIESVGVGSGI